MPKVKIKGRPGLAKVHTEVRGKTKVFIRQQQKRMDPKIKDPKQLERKARKEIEIVKGKLTPKLVVKDSKTKRSDKNINSVPENSKELLSKLIEIDKNNKNKREHSIKELDTAQQVFIGSLNKQDLIDRINNLLEKDPEVSKLFKFREHPDDQNTKILGYSAITGGLYDLYQKYPELIELRGLIVKTDDNGKITDIIARPYPKFFNHGETEAIAFDNLPQDKADKIVIAEKYDGSLIIGHKNPKGEVDLATKGSFGSTQGEKAKEQMNNTDEGQRVKKLIKDLDELGYTPLFEYVDKDMRLTVKYDDSFMVMTGVRNKETGEFLDYETMSKIGELYNIRTAKQYEFKNKKELLNYINSQDNFEGVVARFDFKDGSLIVKVKSDQYFKNFRILNSLGGSLGENKTSPIYAMDAIVAGEMDDIINKLPDNVRQKVEFIKKELNTELQDLYNKYTSGKAQSQTIKKIDKILNELNINKDNLDFDSFVKAIYPHYRQKMSTSIKKKMVSF